jgi:hypothetical protein
MADEYIGVYEPLVTRGAAAAHLGACA